MSHTESILKQATMEWFRELGNAVMHGRENTHAERATERDLFREVMLVGRFYEVSRPQEPHVSHSRSRANLRDALSTKFVSREVGFGVIESRKEATLWA